MLFLMTEIKFIESSGLEAGDRWLTIVEFAEATHSAEDTVRYWLKTGILPSSSTRHWPHGGHRHRGEQRSGCERLAQGVGASVDRGGEGRSPGRRPPYGCGPGVQPRERCDR